MIDVSSPGGWLRLLNLRVASRIVVGLLAANGAVDAGQGLLNVYGNFQGAQAAHYCEAALVSTAAETVNYSCLNPLPEGQSGAVLKDANGFIFIDETPSPLTRLDAGTATTATASGQNLFDNVDINGGRRLVTVTATGSIGASNYLVLAPRDSGGAKYLNFTFSAGSGQTASGNPPAYIRIPIVPCNIGGAGC